MVTVESSAAKLAGESGAESRDDAGSLSRFDLRKLIQLEPTHDPELDPSQVPPMATARLSLFVAHPILYGGVCAHIAEQVETRLTVAANAHDSDKNAAHQGGFAPRTWIKHMVNTITAANTCSFKYIFLRYIISDNCTLNSEQYKLVCVLLPYTSRTRT